MPRFPVIALAALLAAGCARSALLAPDEQGNETVNEEQRDRGDGAGSGRGGDTAGSTSAGQGVAGQLGRVDAGPLDPICSFVLIDGRCVEATDCPPGEHVLTEATETRDRQCAPCQAGTFSDVVNASACTAVTACADTQYESAAPTATSDRVCSELECLEGAAGAIAGDVELTTQEDVDALAGVREVTGDLWIRGDADLPIASLESLRCLQSVGGSLQIEASTIPSLTGLNRVTSVGMSRYHSGLVVKSNNELRNLQGLNRLATVEGHFHVYYNERLENLAGLESLRAIGGNIWINDNPALAQFGGLGSLEGPSGAYSGLYIFGNPNLSRCLAANFASSIDRTCTRPGSYEVTCADVCTCTGNLNDVACPD